MFQNIFSASPAVWAGLVSAAIAIPVLIHLINLLRHRRVQWAAMDFLMKSYKKNRNWIRMKQLFLLLSRIAALLLALALLSQVSCRSDRISRLLGGGTTHHYVLLDDSFSMSQQLNQGEVFDRARETVSKIALRAKDRPNQLFTLLRFSKTNSEVDGVAAEINGLLVDSRFDQILEDAKGTLKTSNLAVGPNPALEVAAELIEQRIDENAIVYVLSDFRRNQWQAATESGKLMARIEEAGAAVELIACTETGKRNLAVVDLRPVSNLRTAGVPAMMQIAVKNYSESAAERIQVGIQQLTFESVGLDRITPSELKPKPEDLPTVFIERIEAGETATRQFPGLFNANGTQVTIATLPDDAVAIDNVRYNTTTFNSSTRVLMIDDAQQLHAKFLSLALTPVEMTGIEPDIRTREFLRDASLDQLNQFDVVYLLDVNRVDERAVKNLEAFAESGGGICFFLGPKTNLQFYNSQLYRDGKGLLPMALGKAIELPELLEEPVPDIAAVQHSVFAPMLSEKNSLLNLVQVSNAIQPPIEWTAGSVGARVAATLRGNERMPLVVERPFGAGVCYVVTTTAAPEWNNWSRNGTFPPAMLLLENQLAAGRYPQQVQLVGNDLQMDFAPDEYLPKAVLTAPVAASLQRIEYELQVQTDAGKQTQALQLRSGQSTLEQPGYYEAWLTSTGNETEIKRFGLNVDCEESDLSIMDFQSLLTGIESANPSIVAWDRFSPEPKQSSASTLSALLLGVLLAFLLGEQLLGHSASYVGNKSTSVNKNTSINKSTSVKKKRGVSNAAVGG